MNGTIRRENLDELESVFLSFKELFPTQPHPVVIKSQDVLENAGKLIQVLHPDGPPEHHVVLAEPAGYNSDRFPDYPNGLVTLCVTGNGPNSAAAADLISAILWLMPEMIRTCRYGLEREVEADENLRECILTVKRILDTDPDTREAANILADARRAVEITLSGGKIADGVHTPPVRRVGIDLLRKRYHEAETGKLSASGTAQCLWAALEEIVDLRKILGIAIADGEIPAE